MDFTSWMLWILGAGGSLGMEKMGGPVESKWIQGIPGTHPFQVLYMLVFQEGYKHGPQISNWQLFFFCLSSFFLTCFFASMEVVERIWYSDGSMVVAYQISLPAGLAVPRPLMMVEMKQLWPPNGCCCRWRWIMKAKVNHSPLGPKQMERKWLEKGHI